MSTLVILGNGFDIWHRLPTAYWHFYNQYNETLDEYVHYFNDFCNTDSEWANFEESLGSFDEDNFHNNSSWQPSLEELADDHKLLYGFEDEISNNIEELVNEITAAFKSWIGSIRVNAATKLIEFPNEFKFISFNYTTTLQDVYGIPDQNILHIHGKVKRDIIFGHGRCDDTSKNISEDNEPWFQESRKSVSSVYKVFKKPVDEILKNNRTQLESYGEITEILVIGHSINNIDIPYFQCILDAYPNAEWKNYNYVNIDEGIDAVSDTHTNLIKAGVPETKLISYSSEILKTIYPVD